MRDYRRLLNLAAQYLEFALYEQEARELRELAGAPIFESDEAAADIIARYSHILTNAKRCDSTPATLNRLRRDALNELRGEPTKSVYFN